MKKTIDSFSKLTELVKATDLGKEIVKEMNKTPLERWVDDINSEGVVIGRLEFYSGRYEPVKKDPNEN